MEQTISSQAKWSQGSLIAFRFFFVYFIFYVFPFPLYFIPYSGALFQPFSNLSLVVINEFAGIFLGHPITASNNGSGDTTLNYATFFLYTSYSFIATVVWSVLDRKRYNYEKLLYWLLILLRYYLAFTMLGYGLVKIFKTQFPFPTIDRLNQSFGESSPMGLLWTFMGYSTAYNIFSGLGEAIGGFLLFFRRTRLLGALVVTVVMSHVVVLNFSYDVPVKLFSLHLLAMAIFLMVPDSKRLMKFFVWNVPVEASAVKPIYSSSKTRWLYIIAKGLLIAYILVPNLIQSFELKREYDEYQSSRGSTKPFGGEFEVQTFILNGKEISTDTLFTRRWKRLLINTRNADIQSTDGATIKWLCHTNLHGKKVMLISPDLSTIGNFNFDEGDGKFSMEGVFYNDTIKVVAIRKSDNSFLLVDRGFHWVNEFPFNR